MEMEMEMDSGDFQLAGGHHVEGNPRIWSVET